MATQSYEELIASATKIKNNELPESNTHDVVGDHLVQMATKAQEEYNQRVTGICEYNVSKQFPTGGIEGSNKYTLELALQKVPTELRQTVGLKCSFLGDSGELESWEYQGGTFTAVGSWMAVGGKKVAELGYQFNYFKDKLANSIVKELYVSQTVDGLKLLRIDRKFASSKGDQWSIVFSNTNGEFLFVDIYENPESNDIIEFASRDVNFYISLDWTKLEEGTQTFINSKVTGIYTIVSFSSSIYTYLLNKTVTENSLAVLENKKNINTLSSEVITLNDNLKVKEGPQKWQSIKNGYYIDLSGDEVQSSSRKIETYDISSEQGGTVNVITKINGGVAISVISVFDSEDKFIKSFESGSVSDYKDIDVTFYVESTFKFLKVSTGTSEEISVYFYYMPNYSSLIKKRKIFFLGSSSTQRMENKSIVGEYKLDNLMPNAEIIWNGVGGENMQAVSARGVFYPIFPSAEFIIPSTTTAVNIEGFTINGKSCIFTGQQGNDLSKLNPVIINGIKGNIEIQNGKFYFTRIREGEEIHVLCNDVIVPNNVIYRGNILITMLGYNGGYDDTDDYINYHEQARTTFNSTHFLFISRLCDGSWENIAKIKEEETVLRKKYGCNTFLLRDYLSRFSISDGIKLGLLSTETDQDKNDKNNGVIPTSIRGDGVHLNEIGYKILSYKLSDTIKNIWFSA